MTFPRYQKNYMTMKKKNTDKILLGTLSGLATGVLVGLLIAPDKGSETRKMITEKGDDYLEGFKSEMDRIVKNIDSTISSTRKELSKMGKKGKETAQEAGEDIKDEVKKSTN